MIPVWAGALGGGRLSALSWPEGKEFGSAPMVAGLSGREVSGVVPAGVRLSPCGAVCPLGAVNGGFRD